MDPIGGPALEAVRERQLHVIAVRLSSAHTPEQLAAITCDEVVAMLGAHSSSASIRIGDEVQVLGMAGPIKSDDVARWERLPIDHRSPSADAIRTSEPVWCATELDLWTRYPGLGTLWSRYGTRSCGAFPFMFEDRTIGALALSFDRERSLSSADREFLRTVGQLTAQALERARLYEALKRSEEQLRSALIAGRAATWCLDIRTMTSTRDPSYQTLVGLNSAESKADFSAIHPDDRDVARSHFDRALRHGTPYEPEVRLRRDDGTYMWIRAHARVLRGPDGKPAQLAGVIVDIDDAKRASLRAEGEKARLYEELREHQEQLEAAVEAARLADRRKDEFLAMLGHELRNPLAPILTALELMELKQGGDMRRERDVIRRQTDHLSRLIDDLLDVSRITRGKLQLSRQLIEISSVLAKAIEIASPLLERRLQGLAMSVAQGLWVDADPTRLAQVFQNLLTNAAKYSEPRTDIALRARAEGNCIVVEVADQGVGIAPELMPRLFDLFVQGERALDRSEGGLGIGLTIARSLCELHGGTIEAASAGPGRGSTFTVRLPRATSMGVALAPAAARPRADAPARVLVVDDNIDAAHLLHELLLSLGHEPAVAHDGPAALELAAAFRPHIAVLDIGLPEMDGYELARKLREQLGPDRLRLIALTGYGQESDRTRSREAGFDHHLVKPISVDALIALLST